MHYKEEGNALNHLAGTVGWIEVFDLIPTMEKQWKAFRKSKGQAVPDDDDSDSDDDDDDKHPPVKKGKAFNNKEYEAEYVSWLDKNYPGYFKSFFNHFDMARRCYKKLKTYPEVWQNLKTYTNEKCVFSESKLENSTMWYLLDKLLVQLLKHDLVDQLVDIFCLCMPTNDEYPWLVKERKDWAKVASLFAPMNLAKKEGEKTKVAVLAEKAQLRKAFKMKIADEKAAKKAQKKEQKKKGKKGKAKQQAKASNKKCALDDPYAKWAGQDE